MRQLGGPGSTINEVDPLDVDDDVNYGGADDQTIGCHVRGRSHHRKDDDAAERDDYFGVGVSVGYGSDSDYSDDSYHDRHYGRSRDRSRSRSRSRDRSHSHSRTPGHSSEDEAGMM